MLPTRFSSDNSGLGALHGPFGVVGAIGKNPAQNRRDNDSHYGYRQNDFKTLGKGRADHNIRLQNAMLVSEDAFLRANPTSVPLPPLARYLAKE